jgi:hypothetical protein
MKQIISVTKEHWAIDPVLDPTAFHFTLTQD